MLKWLKGGWNGRLLITISTCLEDDATSFRTYDAKEAMHHTLRLENKYLPHKKLSIRFSKSKVENNPMFHGLSNFQEIKSFNSISRVNQIKGDSFALQIKRSDKYWEEIRCLQLCFPCKRNDYKSFQCRKSTKGQGSC